MSGNRAWLALLRVACGAVWLFQAFPKFREDYLGVTFAVRVGAMAAAENPWHFYAGLLRNVVLTHTALFSYLTLIGDAAVGICLIIGLLTPYAAFAGIILNVNYAFAAGWMNRTDYSLNILLVVAGLIIITNGAGRVGGLDAVLSGSPPERRSRRY